MSALAFTRTQTFAHIDDPACLPCQQHAQEQQEASRSRRFAEELPPAGDNTIGWHGVITLEGVATGDGRMIEPDALRWATLPLPLRWVEKDSGGHDNAVVVGLINTIDRGAGGRLEATGTFDLDTSDGRKAARQVAKQQTPGVSVDLDEVSFRVEVAKELLDEMDEAIEEGDDGEPEIRQADENGRVTVAEIDADDELMVTTDARVRAATLVAIPAFEEARIELDEELPDLDDTDDDPDSVTEVVAGSYPADPPGSWFNDPVLDAPTHLTVTGEGRVYGHLATWGTCHTAYQGQCVTPPSSSSGYAYFRVGSVITREGSEIPVGHLTLDTLHAKKTLSAADTLAHYEHTGRAVADVATGEDSHGIWVAGALRPGVTEDQVRALRASPLSGDWRRIGSSLELVAALAVNVPGFPIPRPEGLVAGGAMSSLVASGMLPPGKVIAPGQPGALSNDDLRYLKRLADRERREDQAAQVGIDDRAAQLARRVRAVKLARQVRRR